MKTIGKGDAGRLIPSFEKDTVERACHMGREDSVLVLLCLEDAYGDLGDRLQHGLVHAELRDPLISEQELIAALDFVMENLRLIQEAVVLILTHSTTEAHEISAPLPSK